MSRKPSLSPTKLSTFLACPLKYRWTYVHPHRWLMRDKHYYSFGISLHSVLEKVIEAGDRELPIEELDALYDESWIDAGYSSSESMQEAYGEGKEIISQFLESERQTPQIEGKTVAVERMLKHDLGPFILVGRIDRIVETTDGFVEAVDYKSRRREVSREALAHDLAMSCYQLLLQQSFADRQPRARIIALAGQTSADYAMTPDDLSQFADDLRELGERIAATDWYELQPVYKSICRSCDFSSLCTKHPAFAQAFQSVSANS